MVALGGVVAGLGLISGWPYWRHHPIAATITLCCCLTLVTSGLLLRTDQRTRACGAMLIGAGVAWSLNWLSSWNAGPLPLIGQFARAFTFLVLGTGILLYIDSRLRDWPDRLWCAAAVVVLIGGQVALAGTSQPDWLGYRANVTWPGIIADAARFHRVLVVVIGGYLVLAVSYDAVLWRRIRRLSRRQRAHTLPALVAVGACAVAELGPTLTDLNTSLRVYTIQGAVIITVPMTLLWAGLRLRWAELLVGARLAHLTDPPSAERVRAALATVLDDPGLRLHFWLPDRGGYVDSQGQPVANRQDPGDRWYVPVVGATDPQTVVEVSGALRNQPRLVENAVAAATVALEHAQLQVELKARLGQVQVTHARIIEADVVARSRIERNLHDGAQQRLVALAMTLGAIEAASHDPAVRQSIARCRRDVSAALQELRELARGIHPAELTQGGLRPALETAAERLGLRIALDVPDHRFPAAAESTVYVAICDGLADAVRRSGARAARISIAHRSGTLTAEVRIDADAGRPATTPGPAGTATDRVQALGGDITITHDGAETTMKVVLPCAWPSPKTAA